MKVRITAPKIISLAAVSALALAACGADTEQEDSGAGPSTIQVQTEEPGGDVSSGNDDAVSGSDDSSSDAQVDASPGTWPRTVDLGDQQIEIAEEPARIIAVSAETADMALRLAGPERVIAVPASSQSEASTVPDLASQVEQVLPPGTDPDPEQILAMGPDLVLNTTRHGGEETAGDQLEQTGVPVLNLDPSSFSTPEDIAETLVLLGEALGEEELAAELSAQFLADIEEIDAEATNSGTRFLALMSRGDSIMAMDDSIMLPGLAVRAGAVNAGETIGLTQTRPIDAEMIAVANPDVIFVEDFQGMGLEPFEETLSNPALADVPAVANDRVYLVPMSEASGTSGLNTAAGYRTIVDALNE